MEVDTPCKQGYLLFPPQGVLGQLKKSWHKKFCMLFKASKHGIERLEVFENEDDVYKVPTARILTLENCIKITQDVQKHHPNSFVVVTKSYVQHFAALTDSEFPEWISAFQLVAFKDDSSKKTIEEDNDLYCSSGEGVFSVKLIPSDASNRCGLEAGQYTLVITSDAIQLRDSVDYHILFSWPYRYIRRYGYRDGKFTFEAGRKCETGEGTFQLEHSNQQEIFRCLSSKLKSMRKMFETPISPLIECGDNQFQAALSMVARSRSPLPPSPTSATPIHDMSTGSSQPFCLTFSDKSTAKILPLIRAKPCPIKPPRKHIGRGYDLNSCDLSHIPSNNTPLLDYDKVEMRQEAWRTLGVNDVNHVENSAISDNEVESDSFKSRTTVDNSSSKKTSTKILSQSISKLNSVEPCEYDTLQHFGSTTKLNSNPGYKQISCVVPTAINNRSHTPQTVSSNDYETIENMQACRLADDSHHGYGMIRKKSVQNVNIQHSAGPHHKVYNEMEYAIVCKPKRV